MTDKKQPEKTPEEIRQESIKWHCERQQCVGCPKEYVCDEEVDAEDYDVMEELDI